MSGAGEGGGGGEDNCSVSLLKWLKPYTLVYQQKPSHESLGIKKSLRKFKNCDHDIKPIC